MNCQTCLDRLNDELDGGPCADVHEHLLTCAGCRALCQAVIQLRIAMTHAAPPAPPPGLAASIVGHIADDRRRQRRRRRFARGLLTAAAVLVAVGTFAFRRPAALLPTDQPIRVVVGPQRPEPLDGPVTLRDSVTEASSAVVSLTARTADETVAQTRSLLPDFANSLPDDLAVPLDSPAVSLREAGEGLSAGLEPVAASARRAVGLLLRDLTPAEIETRPDL